MTKPSIPELPKSIEELGELLGKRFKTIFQGEEVPIFGSHMSGTHLVLKCPFCSMEFDATTMQGCFGGSTVPNSCPNCGFPHNVMDAYMKESQKTKKTSPERK